MLRGVFAGSTKPFQPVASKPATPDSATVGSSGTNGERCAALIARARKRLEGRITTGVIDRAEIEQVSAARARLFDPSRVASEAFRRACVSWRIDAPVTLRSHRPWIGGLLVAAKGLVGRLLRFHTEVPLARQAEFNRNLLVVLHELVDRLPPRVSAPSGPSGDLPEGGVE